VDNRWYLNDNLSIKVKLIKFMKSIVFLILLSSLATSVVNAQNEQKMIDDSKKVIKYFGGQLKGKLMSGMQKGGPVAAIQVCNTAAENIAEEVSEKFGWTISRTALKLRNTKNTPDAWEAGVLNTFEKRKRDGEEVSKIDYTEIVNRDGQSVFRYMKAIPTGGVCLSCHGDSLTPDIASKLDQLYPDDKARGFKAGDIRGAFSIIRNIP
jgi:cytochrome c556